MGQRNPYRLWRRVNQLNVLPIVIFSMQLLHGGIAWEGIVHVQHFTHLGDNRTKHRLRQETMAHATHIATGSQNGLFARFAALTEAFRASNAKRKIYNQTYRELASLSDRDLMDLGMSRTEIRRVAWQAAYEV